MNVSRTLAKTFLPWSHDALLYEVTPRCNLQCLHCYNAWKNDVDYRPRELPTEKAIMLIEKGIRESRCKNFTFTGGEPTLRDDLEELVACAAKSCEQITLITNGTLLDEARIQSLIAAGVGLFELPLNGPSSELHDRMSGGIASFEQVTKAAVDIRMHGASLAFVFVGTKHNIDFWEDTLQLGIALGAQGFLYNRYNAGGECHGHPEQLMPSVEQVRNGLEVAERYAAEYGIGIGASIAIPPCLIDTSVYSHVGFGYCAAGTDRAYYTIDPMGNVRPCNHTSTVIGNLLEMPLKTMAKSQAMADFREARPGFCAGCGMEEECLGGCKAAGEACYGSLTECDPFVELNWQEAKAGKAQLAEVV